MLPAKWKRLVRSRSAKTRVLPPSAPSPSSTIWDRLRQRHPGRTRPLALAPSGISEFSAFPASAALCVRHARYSIGSNACSSMARNSGRERQRDTWTRRARRQEYAWRCIGHDRAATVAPKTGLATGHSSTALECIHTRRAPRLSHSLLRRNRARSFRTNAGDGQSVRRCACDGRSGEPRKNGRFAHTRERRIRDVCLGRGRHVELRRSRRALRDRLRTRASEREGGQPRQSASSGHSRQHT
jgi:hypothetical protein